MRNLFFLIIFICITLIICEKENDGDEHIKQMVNNYIEELGFKNKKSITRDEFRKLFLKLFESRENNSKDEGDLDIIYSLTNTLFDFIVSENIQKIELEKIYDYFDPNNIAKALKELLKQLGMEKLIDAFSEPFMKTLKQQDKNDNNINKEKNSDL